MNMRILPHILLLVLGALVGCTTSGPNPEEVAKEMYSRETLLGAANRALQDNNRPRALGIYQQLLARNVNDREILTSAATISRELQEYELSAAYYEQLLALSRDDMGLRLELAEVNIQRHHFDAAEIEFKKLAEEMPENWRVWNGLGLIADLCGNYTKSVQFYSNPMKANPVNVDIHNNRGYSLIMAHQYAEAVAVLRDGLRLDANNPRLHNNLLIALAWLGRYDEAISAGRFSLDEWIAINNVGYIAQLKGDYDAAVHLYNAALSSSPRFYPTRAFVLFQLPDLLSDVEDLGLVLGEFLPEKENVLKSEAEVSLGAAVQNNDSHRATSGLWGMLAPPRRIGKFQRMETESGRTSTGQ